MTKCVALIVGAGPRHQRSVWGSAGGRWLSSCARIVQPGEGEIIGHEDECQGV
jgi:hypothetical protein